MPAHTKSPGEILRDWEMSRPDPAYAKHANDVASVAGHPYAECYAEREKLEFMIKFPGLIGEDVVEEYKSSIFELALEGLSKSDKDPNHTKLCWEYGEIEGKKRARAELNALIQKLPEDEQEKYSIFVNEGENLVPPKPGEIVTDARIQLWQKEASQIDEAANRLGFAEKLHEQTAGEYYRSGREHR